LDERADHEHLATGVDLLADEVVGIGPLFGRDEPSLDGSPARWHLVEDRDVEVTEERQAERARNGGGGHRQEMRRALALLPDGQPLTDPEAMLLIDDGQRQVL